MAEIAVGLIGFGVAGAVFHAPLLDAVEGLRVAAVMTSRHDQVARALPRARVVATVDEILGDASIDLVVIASPSSHHFEQARAALAAGKHVVVDKPVTTTAAEADLLVALAASRQRMLTVFHNRRWDGDFMTVKNAVVEGWLGTPVHYEAHFDRFRPVVKTTWREEAHEGSGILYDLGSHLVDQALHLFGMPAAVTADVITQRPGAKVDDYVHLVLDYGRMRAILHTAMLVPAPGPHFLVHGTAASFSKYGLDGQEDALRSGRRPGSPGWGVDPPERHGTLTTSDGTSRTIETVEGAYERFYELVVAHLGEGGPVPVDPRDARDVMKVIDAARASARERKTVSLVASSSSGA